MTQAQFEERANSVISMLITQLRQLQELTETFWTDSIILSYDLNRLSIEFGVPPHILLRTANRARSSNLFPSHCSISITARHELLCTFLPVIHQPSPEVSHVK
ncbi:MAG: hypothetical protein N2248_00335 [candidate division WOR-3 bacterium]|nr:hypothetical protein [candidate division WOR-3 bacterium]